MGTQYEVRGQDISFSLVVRLGKLQKRALAAAQSRRTSSTSCLIVHHKQEWQEYITSRNGIQLECTTSRNGLKEVGGHTA
eukprot:871313-Pelagomonas_calceolata.AAC.3